MIIVPQAAEFVKIFGKEFTTIDMLNLKAITDTLGGVSELLWGLAETAEGSEITPHSLVILARLVEGVQGDLNALIDANRPQKATNRRNTAASQSR